MQRARGQTGAMLQRPHPTLRSRASTCSYSVKGQKSTLLYPAPLSDHHLSRVEGRLTWSTSFLLLPRLRYRLFLRHHHRTFQRLSFWNPSSERVTSSPLSKPKAPLCRPISWNRGESSALGTPVPSLSLGRPPRKPLKVTFEKQALPLCYRKCFKSSQHAGPIYVDHVAAFATSSHDCLLLPAEHSICPASAKRHLGSSDKTAVAVHARRTFDHPLPATDMQLVVRVGQE
jgi:hypothetical protein